MIQRFADRYFASYRLRLTLGYVAIIALLGLAWFASLSGPLTAAVKDQQRTHLLDIARADALALEQSGASAQELATRVGDDRLRVTVVASDGVVLADNHEDRLKMENHASRPEVLAALAGTTGTDVRMSRTEGIEQLYVAVPATYEGHKVVMRVSESLATVASLASQARSTGLLALAAALVISLFVAARLTSIAAAPVKRLADAAHALALGDLRSKVPREAGELGVLSDALEELTNQVRRRIAESEAEQANLRTVLDGLDDGVLLLDGDTIRLANRAMSRLFKAPFGGWRGRVLDSAGLPASLLATLRSVSTADSPQVREIGPDPLGRTVRLFVAPLGADGPDPRVLVVISDVSERARLDAMRTDFVANASHELKTPASSIQLLADAAATAASDDDTEQALVFVGQMRNEAERLRTLVLDLLDLSRLEQIGRQGDITDVRDAVDLAMTGHRATAEAKGLRLRSDVSAIEHEDVFLAVESTDVAIALDNLLSNAIGYTESGRVDLRVSLAGDKVALEIADTGVGIPADALPRVFERFFRVDKGRSRDSGGTGLGLSLVRHVVERNNGEISIDSEIGRGTTVTLLLPRAVSAAL